MVEVFDELIAAFLEGKTDSDETVLVLNAVAQDAELAELVVDSFVMDEIDKIAKLEGENGYRQFGILDTSTIEETDADDLPEYSIFNDILPVAAFK